MLNKYDNRIISVIFNLYMTYEHIVHPFEPVFDENSEILILGSLPSVASRKYGFYYGHPRNRLWSVLAALFDEQIPDTVQDKKAMLLKHRIAMWDVINECDIQGSSDSSVKNAVPSDIPGLLQKTQIRKVCLNGKTAAELYEKHFGRLCTEHICLPSTSPANAAYNLERLVKEWKIIIDNCQKIETE